MVREFGNVPPSNGITNVNVYRSSAGSINNKYLFLFFLYIAGLQTIPKDVLEAAKLDGCVGLKKIRYIEIPLLMTTVTVNLFVSIANSFKAFDIPFALTGGGPGGSTQTIALDIYNDAFGSFRYGYASAKSVILFLMVAAVTLVQLYVTRKKEVQA